MRPPLEVWKQEALDFFVDFSGCAESDFKWGEFAKSYFAGLSPRDAVVAWVNDPGPELTDAELKEYERLSAEKQNGEFTDFLD